MPAHEVVLRTRFYELDPYGHVNHSVYIQYFESARISLLGDVGFGLDAMLADDVQLVVIRLATRFLQAAGLDEELTIDTAMMEAGRVKSRWAQRIRSGEEVITTQLIDFASTNRQGKPRRMPEGLAAAMAPFAVEGTWLGKLSP